MPNSSLLNLQTGTGTRFKQRHNALHSGPKIRSIPVTYNKRRYQMRSRIEIMFGRLKDWRRVATRDDQCPTVVFSAIAPAATVIFSL